jgi:hypothetical protein
VANHLRDAGADVEIHDDHFLTGTPDDVWLKKCGDNDWVALSKDQRIRYRENEKAAVREARVRYFVLTAGNVTGTEMGQILVKALPGIQRLAGKRRPPFIAKVTRGGHVSLYEEFTKKT